MTDDLVKRIRDWNPMADGHPVYPDDLMHEAADRIEALEKRVAVAEYLYRLADQHCTKLDARIEALEAAAKPLSEWFHLHYPVKWEHGGGLKLDRALGADR